MHATMTETMLPTYKARIRFKTWVPINAPDPTKHYHLTNLAQARRRSTAAMMLTTALQSGQHLTGRSNGSLWAALYAALEPA